MFCAWPTWGRLCSPFETFKMATSSAPLGTHPAVGRIKALSKGSTCIATPGLRELGAVCEAGKKVLEARYTEVVQEAQGRPLLQSHSVVGTPMNTKRRSLQTLPNGFKVKCSGRQASDFLVALRMVRSLETSGAECSTAAHFTEATPLTHG